MSLAMQALQQAIYTVLSEDTVLMAMLDGIYDIAPETSEYPFLMFDTLEQRDWPMSGLAGLQAEISLSIYSRYQGSGEVFSVLSRVHELLHEAELSVAGWHLALLRHDRSWVQLLRDGKTSEGRMQLNAFLHS